MNWFFHLFLFVVESYVKLCKNQIVFLDRMLQ